MSLQKLLATFNDEKVVIEKEPGVYVEKDAGGVSLKGVLQRGRLKLLKEKRPWPTGLGFRPSGITYTYCKRLKVAQMANLVQIHDDKPTPKLQLVFDMGHKIHDIIQGYFWDIGILKGSFKCIKCDKIYHNLLAPNACPSGIKSHDRSCLVYKEIQLNNEEYHIRGRSDGVLVIEDEEHIMDVKSIANRTLKTPPMQFCFEDLAEKGPKPDHVVQLTLYMWMSGVHRGHLLYLAKNDHQIKTFAIPYDYSVIEPYLNDIRVLISAAESIMKGEKTKLPKCCGNEKCPCATVFLNK